MTGILERIETKLDQLLAGGGASNTAASGGTGATTATTTTTTTSKVTSEMLTELVQPLVQDEGMKTKIKAVFGKFGIGRLGEAAEAQYGELYAAIKAIADGASAAADDDLI